LDTNENLDTRDIGTLIKVLPIKRKVNQTLSYDSILIWYRDKDGIKKTKYIDRAEVPFYILKNKTSQEALTPPMFIEKDKVEQVKVYSDMLYREIALRTDSMSYYDRVVLNYGSNSYNMKNLLKHNWIYDADMDVADRYIKNFNEKYQPDVKYKLHKCYFDTEVDLMPNGFKDKGYIGFPDELLAPCPINIITLIDGKSMIVHSFITRNPLNESQKDFESKISDFKKYLLEKIRTEDNTVLNDIDITFYNSEEETIKAFFDMAHLIDPDFMLSWNSSFDVRTLMNRLTKLYSRKADLRANGIRGSDQMLSTICDSKYMTQVDAGNNTVYLSPYAYYKADDGTPFGDRNDTFTILDGINWMDSMLYYACIRKAQKEESYKLDDIAEEQLGKQKLPFKPGQTIKNLPWLNFWQFTEYNIRDSLLLYLLETKNLDFDMLQQLSIVTNTRKEKVFKKTISLKNYVCKYAELNGYIMGNNKNVQYGDDSAYFEANYLNIKHVNEADKTYLEAFEKKENYGA
jgi:DNA polymerase elongation subunit (family B)